MSQTSNHPLVLAITGASGVIYGQRLLQVLLKTDIDIHLTISGSGAVVLKHEVGVDIDLDNFSVGDLIPGQADSDRLKYYHHSDFMTPIASGAFKTLSLIHI